MWTQITETASKGMPIPGWGVGVGWGDGYSALFIYDGVISRSRSSSSGRKMLAVYELQGEYVHVFLNSYMFENTS